MAAETVTPNDIAATQLYLQTWERLQATFDVVWNRLQSYRQEVCGQNRTVNPRYDAARGVVSSWNYPRGPFAPANRNGWIEVGFRFPYQTEDWKGCGLPTSPHVFFCISCEEESLPVDALGTDLPACWFLCEGALVTARALHEFSSVSDVMASELSDWFDLSAQASILLLRRMAKSE